MRTLRFRRSAMPSRWALIVLALCVAASMFINYRASAQNTGQKTPTPSTTAQGKTPDGKPEQNTTAAGKADAGKTDAGKADSGKTDTAAPGSAEPAAKPGDTSKRATASKPEDTATIQDDPTLVPDDKESADNNITFPTDI